jgi:hypothetical protein
MRWLVAGAAVLLVSAGTAYAQPGPEGHPPPPRHEEIPRRPRPEAVWMPGHWVWEHGHYVWEGGHYR